jgi:hypothetical protein
VAVGQIDEFSVRVGVGSYRVRAHRHRTTSDRANDSAPGKDNSVSDSSLFYYAMVCFSLTALGVLLTVFEFRRI